MNAPVRLFGQDLTLAKGYRDGTERSCAPEETLERLRPMASRFGITRLANITGLDTIGLPVWVAIRPNSRGLAVSQGKGLTHAASKTSAMMESIEAWHAENIDRPVSVDSAWSLRKRTTVVEFERLNCYEDNPFRADQPIAWIEGYDLLLQCPCWVPLEVVSTNYVCPELYRGTNFVQSSNGLAGGNATLEAIAHALTELIERDAIYHAGTGWQNMEARLRVDLDTVNDSACRHVLQAFQRAGVLAAVFDLTSDLGVPVYACVVIDADETLRWRALPHFSGYGCHLSPAIAMLRALTEAAQSRLTYISGSRDDLSSGEYRRGGNADSLKSIRAALASARPTRDFGLRANVATESFDGDIHYMLARLRLAGIVNVVVVDLQKAEVGIPVVKVVVAGLAGALIRGRAIRTPQRDFIPDGVSV